MSSKKFSKKEVQRKAKVIENIYQKYLAKLNNIQNKQDKIIEEFRRELEQKKIEEIREKLKG